MKKFNLFLSCFLLFSFVLISCGDDDESESAKTESNESTPSNGNNKLITHIAYIHKTYERNVITNFDYDFKYDSQGRVIQLNYSESGSLVNKITIKYNLHTCEYEKYDAIIHKSYKSTFDYDESGRITSDNVTYDDQGFLKTNKSFFFKISKGDIESISEKINDKNVIPTGYRYQLYRDFKCMQEANDANLDLNWFLGAYVEGMSDTDFPGYASLIGLAGKKTAHIIEEYKQYNGYSYWLSVKKNQIKRDNFGRITKMTYLSDGYSNIDISETIINVSYN